MLGRTHLVFGLFICLVLVIVFSVNIPFCLLLLFGSLFPDIDKSSSMLGRRFVPVSWFFRHRGFFHSFYALSLFSVMVYALSGYYLALAFFIGFLSHIFLDLFTKRGISLFMIDKPVTGPFLSGGLFDHLFMFVFLLLNTYLTIVILL